MDIPKKLSKEDFPALWDYAREQKAIANKHKRRAAMCAKMGHIAFHIGLICLGILFSYLLGHIADPHLFKPWYNNAAEAVKQFVVSIVGEKDAVILLLFVGFVAVVLLLIPFLVTLITKLFSAGITGTSYVSRPYSIKSTKEEAQKLLEEVEKIYKYDSYDSWDDYYPMNEVGDLIEVNSYNVIPWLTFALSGWLCFFAGVETTGRQYAGGLIYVLLIAGIALLAIVPLWKLSSIINATLYRGHSNANCNELRRGLTEFIKECEKEEENRRQARLARDKEEAEKKQAEKLKKAAELYAQATQGEELNLNLLAKSADMGDPSACREYGKILFLESTSDLLLKAEQEHKCELAARYLAQVKDLNAENELLWFACRIRYESNNAGEWKKVLNRVRTIKASGKVPEYLADPIDSMIQLLVQTIDGMEAKQQTTQPKKGRFYCRFYNAGICNHQSNEFFIYKCTDPVGQCCNYALLNNGIAYEEY